MGFFNFHGKRDDKQKKKSNSVKKQIMEVLSPACARRLLFQSKEKKSNKHPRINLKNKKYK